MYFIFMLESIYPNIRIVMGVSYISKINICMYVCMIILSSFKHGKCLSC